MAANECEPSSAKSTKSSSTSSDKSLGPRHVRATYTNFDPYSPENPMPPSRLSANNTRSSSRSRPRTSCVRTDTTRSSSTSLHGRAAQIGNPARPSSAIPTKSSSVSSDSSSGRRRVRATYTNFDPSSPENPMPPSPSSARTTRSLSRDPVRPSREPGATTRSSSTSLHGRLAQTRNPARSSSVSPPRQSAQPSNPARLSSLHQGRHPAQSANPTRPSSVNPVRRSTQAPNLVRTLSSDPIGHSAQTDKSARPSSRNKVPSPRLSVNSAASSGPSSNQHIQPGFSKADSISPRHQSANLVRATPANAGNKIQFSPMIPVPARFDVQNHLRQLRAYLQPNHPAHQRREQHDNIKAAIKLYEEGKIDGARRVCIMEGKVVSEGEMFKGSAWSWVEGSFHQCMHFVYPSTSLFEPHKIYMMLRLPLNRGGDGTEFAMMVMHDTGSTTLSIFYSDIPHLGSLNAYTGWVSPVVMLNADGDLKYLPGLIVQMRLVSHDGKQMSDWMDEVAVVRFAQPGLPRLSGCSLRWNMYTATSKQNSLLAISSTKQGLMSALS